METYQLNGEKLAAMIESGAKNLAKNAEFIDSLNVFPVPDGDTGTNMNLSMISGVQLVAKGDKTSVKKVSENLAKGLLMGARGNSGVILSQLFRGFAKSMAAKDQLEGKDFAQAFVKGIETAYTAVMKPVEGTILTVAREGAKAGLKEAERGSSVEKIMQQIFKSSKETLDKTPDLLPILKEVGVADSGGYGLVVIYEGFYNALTGKSEPSSYKGSMNQLVKAEHHRHIQNLSVKEEIEYGYCTEIMIRLEKNKNHSSSFNEESFRKDLSKMGDSLLVVSDDDIVKVHIHTEQPVNVFTHSEKYGNLIKMKVENMREQYEAITNKGALQQAKRPVGIITVSIGEGIKALFESLGDVTILSGGQTMNPSTEDIARAIRSVNAEQVYVLPNNKNILMAAKQAASLLSDEKVQIIPTTTVLEGIAAVLAFHPDKSSNENITTMTQAIQGITNGQITVAVRNTTVNGMNIRKGDYIGMINDKIKVSSADIEQTTVSTLIEALTLNQGSEIVTLLFGENTTKKEATSIETKVKAAFPDVEFEIHEGGQPVYSYLFSVE